MANNVLRCIVTGGVMAMIPTAICWVFFGAHWFTTTYVCGPFPHGGFFNPSFGAWSACFGPSMMLSTMLPLAFAAGVLLAPMDGHRNPLKGLTLCGFPNRRQTGARGGSGCRFSTGEPVA